jgi:hypothetical protein
LVPELREGFSGDPFDLQLGGEPPEPCLVVRAEVSHDPRCAGVDEPLDLVVRILDPATH